jgi:hypothetical protein
MRKVTAWAALLCFLAVASEALAWGDEGHKTIYQTAFDKVKPSTRAAIVRLIQADGQSRYDTEPHCPSNRAPQRR